MTTYNNFKSTTIRGIFNNSDYPDGSILASGQFDRDLTVKNNLYVGTETTNYDASGNITGYTNTGGNIIFKINNTTYTITPSILRSILLNNAFSGILTITNSTNSKILSIKPGYNGSTLSSTYVTYDTGTTADTHLFNGSLSCTNSFTCSTISTINACTLGNGNDTSRVRRNLNIDNVLRIGYNDATDVGALLSNNANLDINGNIYLTGNINSSSGLYATQTYVNSQISSLINSAPTTLDTLSELASALGNDPNFATTITTLIGTKTTLSAVQSNYNSWTGTNTFDSFLPTSTLTPTQSSQLITKSYCDLQISSRPTLNDVLSNNNVWTGTNTFNTSLPTSTLTPTTNSQLTTKTYVDSLVSTKTDLSSIQSNNNTWSGTNTFNTSLPTSTLTPSLGYELTTKAYVDQQVGTKTTLSSVQSNNNTWSGANSFNTSLPTSTLTPSLGSELTTKAYVDSQVSTKTTLSAVQSNNNTWSGTNTFNTSLPTSTLTPTLSTELITKAYADATYSSSGATTLAAVQANNNTWTGTNTFSNNIIANAATITPTQLGYISGLTANAQAQINNRLTLNSAQTITGVKTFNANIIANAYTITPVTLSYIANLSSDAQTQISAKTTLLGVQGNNNTWTGTNAFNTSLPTSTLTPTLATELVTKAYTDTKTTLSEVQANTNTWTAQNTFNGNVYTSTYTSLFNGNLVVNGGATYAYKQINMYGVAQLFLDSASGGNGITALYRDLTTKNLVIDSYYYNNGVGGGVVFRLKNPDGTNNNSDVLSVQPLSVTVNQPLTLNSTLNGISTTTLSYLDATSSIQTQINNVNTKLSGITYTSGTDTTTIDNNVVINGTIKNQYGVLLGATKYLSGTYTNLAFPCEEYILCNLTTFTYASPYTLVLPSITLNNGSITVRILTNSTFVQVYPPGSTTALYDANRVNQSSIMMTPDTFISLTFMATSSGWVVTNYATNNNLVITNSVSTNNLYMYGPTTISSFVNPTTGTQIGYSMSGNNFANFTATLSGTLTPLCTISIPSFGVWMLTLKTRIQSLTNDNYCGYHVAFHAQTNASSLSETAYIYNTQQVPIATNKIIEFSFTTIQAFYSGITFGTQTFTTAPFNIYSGYSAWWATANTGVITHNWKITRIA